MQTQVKSDLFSARLDISQRRRDKTREVGKWEMGKWRSGEMGKWENWEMEKWERNKTQITP